MIHDCRTCRHNGLQSYRGTPCKTCKDKGSFVEADFVQGIREEERARIIELIEKKQAAVEEKLSEIKYQQHHSKIYEEGQLEGERDMCELLIDELRGES